MMRKPRWLYWLIREQNAKAREHAQFINALKVALKIARIIRGIQAKINAFIAPILDHAATLKTPTARLTWSKEPWSHQDRTRYNWGKRQELAHLWQENPTGQAEQDPSKAAAEAKKKTNERAIDRAKTIDRALDRLIRELRNDEESAVRSSLEESYRQVAKDIAQELDDARRAAAADDERIATADDYTKKGAARKKSPYTKIPENIPRLGNYGQSVKFEPSPDQIKAVLNAPYDGRDFSARIWKDTDRLAAELKDMMSAAIINGENSHAVAQKLAQKMGVQYSHAERLIRTEMNRILNESALESMKQADAKSYVFIAIEDGRTCKGCKKKNGKTFKISQKVIGQNFPPLHPHCRCTIAGRFDWEDGDTDDTGGTPNTPQNNGAEESENTPEVIQTPLEKWIEKVRTADEKAAKALEANPTEGNAQAAAAAQDAAMKREEAAIREKIGKARRSFATTTQTRAERARDLRDENKRKAELAKEIDEIR